MSDVTRTYTLQYLVDQGQAAAGFQTIRQGLDGIDQHARRLNATLEGTSQRLGATGAAAASAGGQAKTSFMGATTAVVSMTTALVAVHEGIAIMKELHEFANQVREDFDKLAADVLKTLGGMRELASLRGQSGPTAEMMASVGIAGTKMGKTVSEAADFFTKADSSTFAALTKGNIGPANGTEAEKQKALREIEIAAGRWSQRVGLSGETAGTLLGVTAMNSPMRNAGDASKILGQLDYLADQTVQPKESMFQAFNESYAMLGGEGPTAMSATQTMGYLGALALNMKAPNAKTHLLRASQALRDMHAKQSPYLKSIGIDPNQENFHESFQKFAKDIDKKMAGVDLNMDEIGKAPGDVTDPGVRALDQVIANAGITEIRETRGLFMAMRNQKVYEANQKAALKITAGDVERKNREYFTGSLAGQADVLHAHESLEEGRQGIEHARAHIGRRYVLTQMMNSGELKDSQQHLAHKWEDLTTLNGLTQEADSFHRYVNERMVESVHDEAERLGLSSEYKAALNKYGKPKFMGNGVVETKVPYDSSHLFMNEMGPLIEAAGGNPYASMAGVQADAGMMARSEAKKAQWRAHLNPQQAPMKPPAVAVPAAGAGGAGAGANAPAAGAAAGPQASNGQGVDVGVLGQILTALHAANEQRASQAAGGSVFGTHPVAGRPFVPTRT